MLKVKFLHLLLTFNRANISINNVINTYFMIFVINKKVTGEKNYFKVINKNVSNKQRFY
jgi:hypothetical protein